MVNPHIVFGLFCVCIVARFLKSCSSRVSPSSHTRLYSSFSHAWYNMVLYIATGHNVAPIRDNNMYDNYETQLHRHPDYCTLFHSLLIVAVSLHCPPPRVIRLGWLQLERNLSVPNRSFTGACTHLSSLDCSPSTRAGATHSE